jgi:D-glycero-D-manno-heptose 1,7-bisphosphate phosphatase
LIHLGKKAVFLDRDGTLIEDKHYLSDPEGVEFIDGAVEALRRLDEAGYELVVVTNQSGVGRGYMTEADVEAVHDRLDALLAKEGLELTDIYYAPYIEDAEDPKYREGRRFRKPRPGMIEKAVSEHGLDVEQSFMIGDKGSDVEAGHRAGTRTVLVKTGKGTDQLDDVDESTVDFVAQDLSEAAGWIREHGE